jgi:large subunit ribosomal protein L40e
MSENFLEEIFMGKFAEADAEISNIFICRKCKARNKRNADKCRKCGSTFMRPKKKDIRVKK